MEGLFPGIGIGIFLTIICLLTLASIHEAAGKEQCGFAYNIEECENSKLLYYPNGYHLEIVKDQK